VTTVEAVEGPLDETRLGWIATLYGPVDETYRSLDFLRHQFVRNHLGRAVHTFALADGRPVGHAGAIPLRARLGREPFTVGKVEALVVAEEYRGRREGRPSVAVELLTELTAAARQGRLPLLFALAAPAATGAFARAGYREAPVAASSRVLVTRPRGTAQAALHAAQSVAAAPAGAAAPRARLRPPEADDGDLARTAAAGDGDGEWTIAGADDWVWYAASGQLAVLELGGRSPSRALLRPGDAQTPAQIVSWQGSGVRSALLLLAVARRVARERGAPTLRVQLTDDPGGRELGRACLLLGGVIRRERPLAVATDDPVLLNARPRLTPFFSVTF
jgi:hypothetical protein